MSLKIILPEVSYETAREAACVFQKMAQAVTGAIYEMTETDDGVSDLVVIGSDAVNPWLMNEMFKKRISLDLRIRYGTDDYCIYPCTVQNRRVLILAGGRGRSTLYAVYDYFERYAGCHYFWDGDVMSHLEELPLSVDQVCESPRFEYRGLRYFAHRGLKRFQAEHWSYEDWKQELDWIVKKRLNFFMLRIGMDDVWQRAFPDVVDYPDGFGKIENMDGYDDRSDFWTLRYRGELREKVLAYARKLDLDYPTDCGTMTHWYSRTPQQFLDKVKPSFAEQADRQYTQNDTGCVWDFRKPENMDNYMKLTETMVENYEKRSDLFHTIGLGERRMYDDQEKNFALKLFAYRRIAENLRRRYPNSKLMLASWDFVGWWAPEEVQRLVGELDPERTMVLDYTSDTNDPDYSFLNWGLVGKFPWIYGLFHAYEAESDLRGIYKRSDERLKVAAEDPYCKGMILWPELSHSDPLILEYLSNNAWDPLGKSIEELTEKFCSNRYGILKEAMNRCWQLLLPLIQTRDWGGYNHRTPDDPLYAERCPLWLTHRDVWSVPVSALNAVIRMEEEFRVYFQYHLGHMLPTLPKAIEAMKLLTQIPVSESVFLLRDVVDLIRTVLIRIMNCLLLAAILYRDKITVVRGIQRPYMDLLEKLAAILSLNEDFSILATLHSLQKVAPVNPDFEFTLKRNISNGYCAQCAYELVVGGLMEENRMVFQWLLHPDRETIEKPSQKEMQCMEKFVETPLIDLQPKYRPTPEQAFKQATEAAETAAAILMKLDTE